MKHYTQVSRFLQKYGFDAFKIIAAYEEAAGIPHTERYAEWYGDYGIFEPSLNEDMTYDKLLSRYNTGLKYLGIIIHIYTNELETGAEMNSPEMQVTMHVK